MSYCRNKPKAAIAFGAGLLVASIFPYRFVVIVAALAIIMIPGLIFRRYC